MKNIWRRLRYVLTGRASLVNFVVYKEKLYGLFQDGSIKRIEP